MESRKTICLVGMTKIIFLKISKIVAIRILEEFLRILKKLGIKKVFSTLVIKVKRMFKSSISINMLQLMKIIYIT
jgi:hypothetical protein